MVNLTIVDYLKSYGDKYDLEDLKKEIISKGYSEDEFNEALEFFRREGRKERAALMYGRNNPLPIQKFVGGRRDFGLWKLFFVLFFILLFSFGLIVLFNFMDMSFFGWNIFNYFK